MRIEREWLELLMFGAAAGRRFTQDSPILPDVWIRYGTANHPNPLKFSLDLLLTPHRDHSVSDVAETLLAYLQKGRRDPHFEDTHEDWEPIGLAYNQTTVVARLYFDELLKAVLPMSQWWHDYAQKPDKKPINFGAAATRSRLV